jgi:hypothetical protein
MAIQHFSAHNWRTLRSHPLAELSGALGDLGTFFPILISLTVNHSVSLSSTLIFSGIWNVFTGTFFGISLSV